MKYFALVCVIMSVMGCSKSTGVLPLGEGRYIVSTDIDTGFYGQSDAIKKSIENATLYCNSLNKDILVEDIKNTESYNSSSSNSTVIFQCIDKK